VKRAHWQRVTVPLMRERKPERRRPAIGDFQNLGKSTSFGPVAQTDKMLFRT